MVPAPGVRMRHRFSSPFLTAPLALALLVLGVPILAPQGAAADPATLAPHALSVDSLALQGDDPEASAAPSFSRAGGYLGAGGAFALQNFDIPGEQKNAASIAFRAGYRGYSWLAVEFLGDVLTTFDGKGSQDNDVNGYALTVNGKLVAPLGRVEPWLMAGIGFLDIDADREGHRKEDFVFRSAVGLDVYLTPHWALYGEAAYLLPTGDVKRYDVATFGGGILFRF